MNKAPKIGDRVSYREVCFAGEPFEETRICTGTVRAIYQSWRDVEAADGSIGIGDLEPEREWSAGIEVDAPLPSWWAYPGNRFAPSVSELELLPAKSTAV